MDFNSNVQIVIFIVVAIAIIYSIIAFVFRMIKKEPFWPNLKKMINQIFDALMGAG